MARKAVQGYPEKSLYDNTRFLGVIATSDPLNEGYFKHLVNFDISDTGLSVKPRKGFLTTTFKHNTVQAEYVSLSANTIIFRDQNIQEHIIYDFSNNKGYIADVSAYNIVDKFLPLTQTIANKDWSSVYRFIYDRLPLLESALVTAGLNDIQKAAYIQQRMSIYGDAKVQHIVDHNNIRKSIMKIKFMDDTYGEYIFFLEMYYRKDAVPLLNEPADTLVFSAVNTTEHPSHLSYERNIASPLSIIPDPLQKLYTVLAKPDGHVNHVGLVYVEDADKKYYLTHVYPKGSYNFIPHFDLHSALQTSNNDMWAWSFDVLSTKNRDTTVNLLAEDLVFRSNWYKLQPNLSLPVPVFARDNSVDFTNTDRTLRHYKQTKHIIFVVPPTVNGGITGSVLESTTGVWTPPALLNFDYAPLVSMYDSWLEKLSNVSSKRTLRIALEELKNSAKFFVKSLKDAPSTDPVLAGFTTASQLDAAFNTMYAGGDSGIVHLDKLKDAQDILDLIDAGYFKDDDITFKLLPFLSDDLVEYKTNGVYDGHDYRLLFASLKALNNTYATHTVMLPRYNLYNGNSQQLFYIPRTLEDTSIINMVGVNTNVLNTPSLEIPNFREDKFFENGYSIVFYIRPYDYDEIMNKSLTEKEAIKTAWRTSAYTTSSQVVYGYDSEVVSTIVETVTKEPADIQTSRNLLVFEDNRLVVWHNNIVYISEPGQYYYFKEENKKEYPEKIVKVLVFKTILLVFTVQNLYAIYLGEIDTLVADDKGNMVPATRPAWLSQAVLYNILANQKYADMIQVFNQMVLFYSEDGQMFMIKPNTMIDSETQFSLQYFNKSVNDILLNYHEYINERLASYNIDKTITKDDVIIKGMLSVNFIKIFYCVPNYITYILIYDVINNRYTVQDTITFTNIKDKMFIESGELLVTEQDQKIYLTMPYTEMNITDNMCDMSFVNSFKKIAINALIDTGNLNLNNHLRKRFRDLHVTFKNLSASTVLMNVETTLDDIVSHPFYNNVLEVQEINGTSYFLSIPKDNDNDLINLVDINQVSEVATDAFKYALDQGLFENNNLLMDFSNYTSSKLLTHKSSILGMGNVLRIKLRFVSKGLYKVQSFGIVYKERRV